MLTTAVFNEAALPPGRVLVLAPHPDDFEAVAVTLKILKEAGRELFLAVATSGASGVEDSYVSKHPGKTKRDIREAEQAASSALFGLPPQNLEFLRLTEDDTGNPEISEGNAAKIADCLRRHAPSAVFLPHWRDTNAAHRRVFAILAEAVADYDLSITAYLNRDPKTISMRYDIHTPFDSDDAEWKAKLLRTHDSQQQRNLNTRGQGFDKRILDVNRETATLLNLDAPFAEVFEVFPPGRFKLLERKDDGMKGKTGVCGHLLTLDEKTTGNVMVDLFAKLMAILGAAAILFIFNIPMWTPFPIIFSLVLIALTFNALLDNRHKECLKCGRTILSGHAVATCAFMPSIIFSPLLIIAASYFVCGRDGEIMSLLFLFFGTVPTILLSFFLSAFLVYLPSKPALYARLTLAPIVSSFVVFILWIVGLRLQR